MMESSYGATTGPNLSETEFQRLGQNIGSNIQKIQQNVLSIQKMIAQIGSAQDNHTFQQQLHQIQHYTGQLAKDTSKHLRELGACSRGESDRQWRLQRERLQNDFTKALNAFQAAQRTAAQKEKEIIARAKISKGLKAPSQAGGGSSLLDLDESQTQGDPLAQGQSKTRVLLQEDFDVADLQERERAMRQLESDIVDVNTIFKDLATMVHEQGEMVDSIEHNVDSTHIRVSEGADHLRQAENYRNKARKKKLIMLCVGIIILVILIIIIASAFN